MISPSLQRFFASEIAKNPCATIAEASESIDSMSVDMLRGITGERKAGAVYAEFNQLAEKMPQDTQLKDISMANAT